MNEVPILDLDVIARRISRGPDDCRRCGLRTVADVIDDVTIGRSCPSCGHRWTYPAPVEDPLLELADPPDMDLAPVLFELASRP
jgi:hypothetical protein